MSTNVGKQKRGRPAPNKRGRQFDKAIMMEGVYSNPRLVHSTLLLVGCNVQVTVKNGGIYEGIFKTVSPSSQIVLEMAHKVDPSSQNTVPTKQMLINNIIFNLTDVVTISAQNVDMDFANKDSFTDSAISKFNNGSGGVEKELQPWDAEGGIDSALETLDRTQASSANGWDAEDMFNVNAEKFKVESSYDPNLSQYTTPLVKKDTKEYREKEAKAARLAQEIENADDFGKRMALENGDGDGDEEMMFSAVCRPGEANNNSSGVGKYVPPHQRKTQPRPARLATGQPGTSSGDSQTPSPQQPSPSRTAAGPSLGQRPPHQATGSSVTVSVSSTEPPQDDTADKGKDDRRQSEVPDRGKLPERANPSHAVPQIPLEKKLGNAKQPREKINELLDWKNQFILGESGGNKQSGVHDRKPQPQQPSAGPPQPVPTQPGHLQATATPAQPSQSHQPVPGPGSNQAVSMPQTQPPPAGPDNKPSLPGPASVSAPAADKKEADKKDSDCDEKEKKFNLNPNAKEFVPLKRQQQISTPPRAATQSPVVNISVQGGPSIYPGYIIPNTPHGGPPQAAMIPGAQTHQQRLNKRAVVSACRPDLTAATATGQPLLQTPIAGQNTPYAVHPYNVQIAGAGQPGAIPQVFTQGMVQMPGNARMVNPSLVQGATTPTDQVGFPQGQQPHLYVQQAANMNAMQSYVAGPPPSAGAAGAAPNQQGPPSHPIPAHMTPHPHATPPHSQPNTHMPSQGAASAGHPNPSPVPQTGQASHPHGQQGHPPSSGTPQPVLYHGQGGSGQAGHPPLQPSPHTPTSPQAIFPQPVTFSMPYSYAGSQSYTVQPTVTYSSSNSQYTTVTHAHHTQHSHIPSQVVMVAPQHAQPNPQPGTHNHAVNPQLQHSLAAAAAAAGGPQPAQYQINHAGQHPQPHPVQGGPPIHGPAGPGLPLNMSVLQHPQMAPQYHHNQ